MQRRGLPVCPQNVVYVCARILLPAMGRRLSTIKSGYDLFQIATDDIPSKIVFAGFIVLFCGWVCCYCSRCFSVNRLVGFVRASLLS